MVKVVRVLILPLALLLSLLMAPAANAITTLPDSMASLGDSITRAADVCCWYGDHPGQSWSTGNNPYDGVNSQYERLVALHPAMAGLCDAPDRRKRPVQRLAEHDDGHGNLHQRVQRRLGCAAHGPGER